MAILQRCSALRLDGQHSLKQLQHSRGFDLVSKQGSREVGSSEHRHEENQVTWRSPCAEGVLSFRHGFVAVGVRKKSCE